MTPSPKPRKRTRSDAEHGALVKAYTRLILAMYHARQDAYRHDAAQAA